MSMDTENTSDERNQPISKGSTSAKLRMKERSHSQTTSFHTDINDPENLDYEDMDDNHSPGKLDDDQDIERIDNPVKTTIDEIKSFENVQNEQNEISDKPTDIKMNNDSFINNNTEIASDEGELDEADLEDGEIQDPSASKTISSFSDDQTSLDDNRNQMNSNTPSSPQAKVHCRFFLQGRCHWGSNCKFMHPNNETIKNPIVPQIETTGTTAHEISSPSNTTATANTWIPPPPTTLAPQFFLNPALRGPPLPIGTESAWERGLRSAKTLREQSMRRKQQDKDFNEKKFNLTLRDTIDEKDGDDNLLNVNRPTTTDIDSNNSHGTHYHDQRSYSDRYHSYTYSNSSVNTHYNNNQRMNNHSDPRIRHSDDYTDSRNNNRNRKENLSSKHNKLTLKREDSSSYKRISSQQQYTSGSHHNHDVETHFNQYSIRRGDDWHDPWDRSRNHGNNNRRSSGGGRDRSYSSSSSATSSSSSRSSHSRSHSTSSSSRSRSRSRSRPKRRSPSVTRTKRTTPTTKSSEMVKNGNEKKSNSNKQLTSPLSTNKFLPGRQISSHTLKKVEKCSNSSNSLASNHLKDQHGKDLDVNIKKSSIRKENYSTSSSSSSSSDSDTRGINRRSSSSSSGSSSSENDTRIRTKLASGGNKSNTGNNSGHSTKSINRQLSSSSSGGTKTVKTKTDSSNRDLSSAAKKRRDTSPSTDSMTITKKPKLNDSQRLSTDTTNTENSDSCKKKEKQKVLKKLQEVEKLVKQRSTKTSS